MTAASENTLKPVGSPTFSELNCDGRYSIVEAGGQWSEQTRSYSLDTVDSDDTGTGSD